jgi:hypothetical protein
MLKYLVASNKDFFATVPSPVILSKNELKLYELFVTVKAFIILRALRPVWLNKAIKLPSLFAALPEADNEVLTKDP